VVTVVFRLGQPQRRGPGRLKAPVIRYSFEMADPKHLGRLLNAVRDVEGVVDVYSVTADQKAAPQPDSLT